MALIDKASLLMVPSTYEAGTLYNVLPSGNRAPDSTDQNSGYDQTRADFDFDRGSNASATRIGSDGLLKKYRENLLVQSNQFDTTWTTSNTSITSGQSGYDGSNDAWLLNITGGTIGQNISQSVSASGVQTFSVYAKAGTLNWIMLLPVSSSNSANAYFNLADGTTHFIEEGITSTIEDAGNGWYRCSLIVNKTITAVRIYLAENDQDITQSSGNILIQSAQLEKGMVATDYLDSTSVTGKAGVLVDLPRINYDANGENGALLLEPSRVNLITQSEYFGSYTPLSATITDNVATSPEGVLNAASFIETTASGRHRAQTNSFAVTSGSTYTLSMFAKIASGSRLLCLNADYLFNARAYFNLVSGSVEGIDSGSASIEDYGNGWYRCSITGTSTITGSSIAYFGLEDGASDNGYIGDGTSGHYWYGLQAESGSYVSSYIPTMGTSETRAADEHNLSDITSLIGTTQGSWFLDWEIADSPTRDNSDIGFELSSDDNRDELNFSVDANGAMRMFVRVDNAYSQKYTTTNKSGKWCLVWNGTSLKLFQDGLEVYSDASVLVYNDYTTYGGIANLQYKVKQILLFPTALTDAECVTLTTL